MEGMETPVRFVYETPCGGKICGWLTVHKPETNGPVIPLMLVDQNAGGIDPLGESRVPNVPLDKWFDMSQEEALGTFASPKSFWTHMRQREGWSLAKAVTP